MLIEPIACLWRSVTATLSSTKKADASNARRPNITENKTPYTNKDNGDAIGGYALSPHLRPSGKCEAQRKVCFATNSTILRDALATRAFHVDGTIQEFLPQAVRHDTCAAHVTALPPPPPPPSNASAARATASEKRGLCCVRCHSRRQHNASSPQITSLPFGQVHDADAVYTENAIGRRDKRATPNSRERKTKKRPETPKGGFVSCVCRYTALR